MLHVLTSLKIEMLLFALVFFPMAILRWYRLEPSGTIQHKYILSSIRIRQIMAPFVLIIIWRIRPADSEPETGLDTKVSIIPTRRRVPRF